MPDTPEAYTLARASADLTLAEQIGAFTVPPAEDRQDILLSMLEYVNNRVPTPYPDLNTYLQGAIDLDVQYEAAQSEMEKGFFGKLIAGAVNIVTKAVRSIGQAIAYVVNDNIQGLKETFSRSKSEERENTARAWINHMAELGIVDTRAMDEIDKLFGSTGVGVNIMPIVMVGVFISGAVRAVFNTAGGDFAKRLLGIFTPNAPTTEQLIRTAFMGNVDADTLATKFGQNGLSPEDIDIVLKASVQTISEGHIATLYLRDELSLEDTYSALHRLGYSEGQAEQIVKTWTWYPGAADLLRLVAKEAFEPDIISKYGYDAEFPADQLPYMRAIGISDDMALKLWYAHWDTPSINQGYEMLHRGVIGMSEVDDLFRTVEIPPYWRDKLLQIAYSPYTRVDSRRMYKEGVLTVEDLYKNYQALGYDPEHAARLTEWTVKDVQTENKELTRSQIEGYYRDGLVDSAGAVALLMNAGYDESTAGLIISSIDFAKQRDLDQDTIKLIGDAYTTHYLTRTEALAELRKLEIPERQVTLYMQQWDLKIRNTVKYPSKTDLDKFLKAEVITEPQWYEQYRKLGYDDQYIDWYYEYLKSTTGGLGYATGKTGPTTPSGSPQT